MSHETFDSDPALRTAMHLRELLIGYGTLPPRDRNLTLFAAWLDSALPRYSPDTARLLHAFATWHHLRRMRELSFRNQLSAGSAHTARQEITVAGQLLTHLETHGVAAEPCGGGPRLVASSANGLSPRNARRQGSAIAAAEQVDARDRRAGPRLQPAVGRPPKRTAPTGATRSSRPYSPT